MYACRRLQVTLLLRGGACSIFSWELISVSLSSYRPIRFLQCVKSPEHSLCSWVNMVSDLWALVVGIKVSVVRSCRFWGSSVLSWTSEKEAFLHHMSYKSCMLLLFVWGMDSWHSFYKKADSQEKNNVYIIRGKCSIILLEFHMKLLCCWDVDNILKNAPM